MPASNADTTPSVRAFVWKGIVIPCLVLGWFLLPIFALAYPEILPGSSNIGRKGGLATALSFMVLLLSYGLAWLAMTIVGLVAAAIAANRKSVGNAE